MLPILTRLDEIENKLDMLLQERQIYRGLFDPSMCNLKTNTIQKSADYSYRGGFREGTVYNRNHESVWNLEYSWDSENIDPVVNIDQVIERLTQVFQKFTDNYMLIYHDGTYQTVASKDGSKNITFDRDVLKRYLNEAQSVNFFLSNGTQPGFPSSHKSLRPQVWSPGSTH